MRLVNLIQFPPEMDKNWVRYGLAKFGHLEICPNFANPYLTQFSSISGGNCITHVQRACENLDMQIKMKHQVVNGLQDATEMVTVTSTPAPLQEITPCQSSSVKRKVPPSVVRMNLGISEGDIESGNGDGDITES